LVFGLTPPDLAFSNDFIMARDILSSTHPGEPAKGKQLPEKRIFSPFAAGEQTSRGQGFFLQKNMPIIGCVPGVVGGTG
jgi:hypothetical protein